MSVVNKLFRMYVRRGMCTLQKPERASNAFKNPCLSLQEYLEIPIFKSQNCFNPSVQSIKLAQEIFIPKRNKKIACISKTIHQDFPLHNLPEVAFLGKCNAGKSSLLKRILHEVPELRIRTSKKAGATKSLRFYQIENIMCLVDMPGYGIQQPKYFESSVIYYLKNRKNLVKTFFLVDGKVGFNSWDDAALQMLEDLNIPFAIVMTKIDEVPNSQRLRNFLHLQNIRDTIRRNSCFPELFMLSSKTYEGMHYFLAFLAHITGNINVD